MSVLQQMVVKTSTTCSKMFWLQAPPLFELTAQDRSRDWSGGSVSRVSIVTGSVRVGFYVWWRQYVRERGMWMATTSLPMSTDTSLNRWTLSLSNPQTSIMLRSNAAAILSVWFWRHRKRKTRCLQTLTEVCVMSVAGRNKNVSENLRFLSKTVYERTNSLRWGLIYLNFSPD